MHVRRQIKIISLAVVFSTLAPALVGATTVPPPPANATPGRPTDHWGLVNTGAATRLEQVIWTGREFVAVGGTTIVSSRDGLDWKTTTPAGLKKALWSVATNNKIYVAVGDGGTIVTSPDLKTWTTRSTDETKKYSSVFWLGSKFLAIGETGVNASSPDGETWTMGTPYGNFNFTHGTWNGSRIEVGALNSLIQSDDGTSFAKSLDNTGRIWDVAWGDDQFIAVGNSRSGVLTSPDGGKWTKHNPGVTTALRGICWTGQEFVAVGDHGVILTSADAMDWKPSEAGGSTVNLESVTGNGSVLVAVSDSGAILSTNFQSLVPKPGAFAKPANGATSAAPANATGGPLPEDTIKSLVIITGDISTGSGFIAEIKTKFFIVTNQHVLSGNKKITITGMDGTKYPTTGALYGATDYDVAILEIPENLAKSHLELMDDPQSNASVGDPVTVPGNSLGMSVPLQINGKLLGIGPELVEVDAKFVPGNSGSPIIDRAAGQVIGIATLAVTYNQDTITKFDLTSNTRWFGYRLDIIDPVTGWQKLDWSRFSAEGVKLEAIISLSKTMIAILANQTPPVTDDVHVRNAVEAFKSDVALAQQQNSKQAFIEAYKDFHLKLHNIVTADLHDLASQPLYPYHTRVLKQLQDLQTALDAAYAEVSAKIDALSVGKP
jgi:hypothetical protein